jgi:hypothetical protein
MNCKLEVYSGTEEPVYVVMCKSADSARQRATNIRKLAKDTYDENVWFRIIDHLGNCYQYTVPQSEWRIKWFFT